ncbi:hypothetical protein ACFW5D_30320 [Streptomyces sp. NPDC058770]|uniref:hypothetical protein n=1 Tax=Streptomyces sp. NPDC058770 TaxID=3346631 RepID=UPI00368BA093
MTFYLRLLNRLSSGEFPVDCALVERIDRTVDQLIAALEPIESAAATASVPGERPLSAAGQAALLAIAGGAKLYEHLLTGRLSVTAASGTCIPYAELQKLEGVGLVSRDTGHPVHASQPVELTGAGRAALLGARRPRFSCRSHRPGPVLGRPPPAHRR